jgi:hypothetical protein
MFIKLICYQFPRKILFSPIVSIV